MGKTKVGDDPVSFTDTNADTAAGGDKATGSAMMDLISGLQKNKGSTTSGSTTSGSTGRGKGKKKKKGKKGKKTVIKRKRRKDRYESQNYLLRIEGTLCCASIVIAIIWLVSLFIVMLICGIWSGFDFTATTDSVKDKK
ncbi:hypothetical protein GCK32_017831 [Trichostrongylus colubriformis]|uniref:Uncharacterized protein n=1 Tax=Trichostrongylus colubriformis TaxID=6319 RepID=A0AAN8FUD4_TRICO